MLLGIGFVLNLALTILNKGSEGKQFSIMILKKGGKNG